jgi:hypothetical protein
LTDAVGDWAGVGDGEVEGNEKEENDEVADCVDDGVGTHGEWSLVVVFGSG